VKQVVSVDNGETPCSLVQTTKALFKDLRADEALAHFSSGEADLKKKS